MANWFATITKTLADDKLSRRQIVRKAVMVTATAALATIIPTGEAFAETRFTAVIADIPVIALVNLLDVKSRSITIRPVSVSISLALLIMRVLVTTTVLVPHPVTISRVVPQATFVLPTQRVAVMLTFVSRNVAAPLYVSLLRMARAERQHDHYT